jgi:hypothetical protein
MLSGLVRQLVFGWPFGCIVEFGDLGLCWSVFYVLLVLMTVGELHLVCWWLRSVLLGVT